jgi:carboxyl-terminal processing protease
LELVHVVLGFFHAVPRQHALALLMDLEHMEFGFLARPPEDNLEHMGYVIHEVDGIIPANDQVARLQAGFRLVLPLLNDLGQDLGCDCLCHSWKLKELPGLVEHHGWRQPLRIRIFFHSNPEQFLLHFVQGVLLFVDFKVMIERLALRVLPLFLGWQLALPAFSVETAPPAPSETQKSFHPLNPGPADGRIAYVTARMLEQLHYLKQPFNADLAGKFLDRYLETLDPQHVHFTQADLADFESYRTNLDRLTLTRTGISDTRPAYEIFNRYLERLQQRVAYADELLKTETFNFDTDERVTVNRRELPYPKDLEEAKQLWRERLEYEYLQEKLGKIDARKKVAKEKDQAPETKSVGPKKTDAEDIVETLSHRYHRNLRTFVDWDSDDVIQIYLTALAHVYDPHSDYFGRAQLDTFSIGMNLSLFGIGAELTTEDGYCTIRRLLPGGPASKSKKLKEKDRIVAVAQGDAPPVDVVDMSLNKAVQLIRGAKGTEVRLTVIPAAASSSDRTVVTLVRDEIKLEDQEAKAKLIELPGDQGGNLRLGVIDLPSFYASFDPTNIRGKSDPKSTTADVAKLLTKLKQEKVGGVILDLRRNGGGSLEEAIRLTGLFIKEGPIVQVRDTEGGVQVDDDTDPSMVYDGPLIVLTSRFSASASEILAGALQDYGRAIIVGDAATHGKGTVQSVNPLKPYMKVGGVMLTNDPGALKLTIKKFYRASGASTQLRGVEPDIVLPSILNESKDIGESALENPLPWDTIPSAKYDHLDLVAPYIADLRKRSGQRVADDRDFTYIREDIEHFKKVQSQKTVSLNESERLKEKEEAEARQKARDKERLARQDPNEKVFEISLKQAGIPGLPSPVEKTNALAKVSGKAGSVAGGGTNIAASASRDTLTDPSSLDDALDDEKAPAVDATLVEAKRILVDYLSLLHKNNIALSGPRPRE